MRLSSSAFIGLPAYARADWWAELAQSRAAGHIEWVAARRHRSSTVLGRALLFEKLGTDVRKYWIPNLLKEKL